MSAAGTWMPLYIGDYLADTGHLRAAEHGAYLLLIMHYWRNGPLPDEDGALARIARLDRKEAASILPCVRAFFSASADGLRHRRIDDERAKAADMEAKARAKRETDRERLSTWREKRAKPHSETHHETRFNGVSDTVSSQVNLHHHHSSDADASGAGAAPKRDLFGVRPRSAREALFSDGLAIVARLTGKSEGKARAVIGGWLKALDDDCAALMAKLREAESKNPADPMAWITAACRPRGGGGEQRMSALGQRLVGIGMPVGDFVQDVEGVNE